MFIFLIELNQVTIVVYYKKVKYLIRIANFIKYIRVKKLINKVTAYKWYHLNNLRTHFIFACIILLQLILFIK